MNDQFNLVKNNKSSTRSQHVQRPRHRSDSHKARTTISRDRSVNDEQFQQNNEQYRNEQILQQKQEISQIENCIEQWRQKNRKLVRQKQPLQEKLNKAYFEIDEFEIKIYKINKKISSLQEKQQTYEIVGEKINLELEKQWIRSEINRKNEKVRELKGRISRYDMDISENTQFELSMLSILSMLSQMKMRKNIMSQLEANKLNSHHSMNFK